MNLEKYLLHATDQEREQLAEQAETSLEYLTKISKGEKTCSWWKALDVEKASEELSTGHSILQPITMRQHVTPSKVAKFDAMKARLKPGQAA